VKRARHDPAGTLEDFRAGAKLDHGRPAFFVFLALAEQGHPEGANRELAATLGQPAAANSDPQGWQSRIGAFLLGQINFDALLSTASSPFDFLQRSHTCEAWFYQGLSQEIAGHQADARHSFEQARATKRQSAIEYRLAGWELRALAPPPPSP
jgi:lipoprotein NlpI